MSGDYHEQWRDVFDTARRRPASWCVGCGYARVVRGRHRTDCTNPEVMQRRRRAIIATRLAEIAAWRQETS